MRTSRLMPALVLALMFAASVHATDAPGVRGGRKPLLVTIRGEVARPGEYAVRPGERISDLLRKCGGITENAFPAGAVLARRSARARQAEEIAALSERLRDAGHPLSRWVGTQTSEGRVPVTIDHPRLLKGTPADIPLEDGDTLAVPARKGVVRVDGAVRQSTDVPYLRGEGTEYYVRKAGGATDAGDPADAIVRKAGGRVVRYAAKAISWSAERGRWELSPWGEPPPSIESGDLLYIPTVAACWPDPDTGISRFEILRRILEICTDIPPAICRNGAARGRAGER